MTPTIAATIFRSAIRIGRTAHDAFEQYAQERPFLVPDADRLKLNMRTEILRLRDTNETFHNDLDDNDKLGRLWNNGGPSEADEKILFEITHEYARREVDAASEIGTRSASEISGGVLVSQWAQGKGPVSPFARVMVALTDVGLEFIGANPQVLGVGGEGEKLAGRIASVLADALPDAESSTELGPKERFAERLAAQVLRSGLSLLIEKPDRLFEEEHLQSLLKATLPEIVDSLPDEISQQVQWRDTLDALLGPAFGAALTSLADNQAAYLGSGHNPDSAVGVILTGLLKAAAKMEPRERISKEAISALVTTTLKVASENPALILGEIVDEDLMDETARSNAEKIAVSAFENILEAMSETSLRLSRDLVLTVTLAAIEGVRQSGPALIDPNNPWDKLVAEVADQVLDGLATALDTDSTLGGAGRTGFSKAQLGDLARLFAAQVAETPHMIIGGRKDLQGVVVAVATAMAAAGVLAENKQNLLTVQDWQHIAKVALSEAAANPGRLFGFVTAETPAGRIAAEVISSLLNSAAEDLNVDAREVGPVLIGATLREAIVITLKALGGNLNAALEQRGKIKILADKLNKAASTDGRIFGGKEWLRLYMVQLPRVLAGGDPADISEAEFNELLS